MEAEVFQRRYRIWQTIEAEYGRSTTPGEMEKRTGVNHGYWSMWATGTGKRKSQMAPNDKQWKQLRLSLGMTWYAAFEDVYQGVPEITLVNRTCPICANAFRGRGHQVYDLWFCRVWAGRLRDEERRRAASGIRAV